MKIALVHDYLREYGGAERVVEAMHEIWPEAPLYTAFVDWGNLGDQGDRFRGWDIRTARIELIPGIRMIPGIGEATDWMIKKFHSPLRFFAPKIWESFDLSGYDVVITSSGWFMCRGVKTKKLSDVRNGRLFPESAAGATRFRESPVHICYIHHPPRNLYGYATGSTLQKYWPVRAYATVINHHLRQYDFETAQNVDYFIANSNETARRVEKFYRRESKVIYPPASLREALRAGPPVERQKAKGKRQNYNSKVKNGREYYLSVGRLMWAKRVDLAIEACNRLKLPLKIVGTGPEETALRKIAGPTVEFVGSVSDEELAKLYAGAKALLFCALDEDFGMVPVEAMSFGTPVIALGQGGVPETVIDGKTGMLFYAPEAGDLKLAIQKMELGYRQKDYEKACKTQAEKFGNARFMKELKTFVEDKYRRAHSSR